MAKQSMSINKSENKEQSQEQKKTRQKLDENVLVPVSSNVKGGLIYKSPRSGQVWKFTDFGDEDVMELSELRTMLSSQRAFLEKGWLKVMDQEAIDYLNLARFQKNVVDLDDIDHILEQSPEQIKQVIKEANTNTKSLIFGFARDKYVLGELRDVHIIKAIEEGLGQKLDPNN
ncbi:hypothetical protein GRF59_15190 [Paenibacillus sp. HJL G12]|uniref:Uncharacterized protein n=1 Tax=Paenibacillus dendrobii TaxID=2691084 RepID=A0A7X3IK84_9BACL|nr:hypothetical protein [Paenibacillus dendrobii]MWV44966.1 hypothetical protein [Paenibacillus dendrobii]